MRTIITVRSIRYASLFQRRRGLRTNTSTCLLL